MATKKSTSVALPSLWSYTASIRPSDARMFGINTKTGAETAIIAQERQIVSTLSDTKSLSKFKKEPEYNKGATNIQSVSFAQMPTDTDALKVTYSVYFYGNVMGCHAQSMSDTPELVNKLVSSYAEQNGFVELAYRYLQQITSAEPVFRNKQLSNEWATKVTVGSKEYEFKAGMYQKSELTKDHDLVRSLASVFKDQYGFMRVGVEHVATDIHELSEVYPSQKMLEKGAGLATAVGTDFAVITAQKIGNSIRTIDDWYDEDAPYSIPVEPFGIDKHKNRVLRAGESNNNKDFYTTLSSKLIQFIDSLKDGVITNDIHYVVAVLIRGGVFSASK